MSDPVASDIPAEAIMPHSRLMINLGGLDLESSFRYEAAVRHLQGLNLENMYSRTLDKLHNRTQDTSASQLAEKRGGIFVDLHGLASYSQQTDLAACMNLWAPILDKQNALALFCYVIQLSFFQAGLLWLTPDQEDRLDHLRELYTTIISTGRMNTDEENYKFSLIPLGNSCRMRPRFNAIQFWTKYVDFTWARDFQLEKLTIRAKSKGNIYKDGKIVGTGYRDVASVPLPGASGISTGPDLDGETFVPPLKEKKWAWRNTLRDRDYRKPSKWTYQPGIL